MVPCLLRAPAPRVFIEIRAALVERVNLYSIEIYRFTIVL